MRNSKVIEIGHIEKGTGKHQSNVVYSGNGVSPTLSGYDAVKSPIKITVIIKDNGKTIGKRCDIAPTVLARDWKGWNTYGMAAVMETATTVPNEFFLTDEQIEYALDKNDVTKGTGFDIAGSTFTPRVARSITSRGSGGQQRCKFSNFIIYGMGEDVPVEKVRKLLWNK